MNYEEYVTEMNDHYYRANCYHSVKDPQEDCTSGNHHVINATHYLIMSKLGPILMASAITSTRFIASTMVDIGVYSRHPLKMNEPQTQDDYIGICANRAIPSNAIPLTINTVKSRYYNNLPGVKTTLTTKWNFWHGKFVGNMGVYKKAAGATPSLLNRTAYVLGLYLDVLFPKAKTDVSGRILQWLANSVMKGDCAIVDHAIYTWEAKIEKDYPGRMGEVLGIYHGVDHPFAKVMQNEI